MTDMTVPRWGLGRVIALSVVLLLALVGCSSNDADGAGEATAEPGTDDMAGAADGRPVKLGYVSPQTGALAGFGEADSFVVDAIQEHLAGGIDIGGTTHPIEIIVKDSQSDPNNAADAAADLMLEDEVDIVLVSSTPETTNPVSDQCEINGVPCISTVAPWQPWFLARGGDPAEGFEWTYHFFWGLEDIIAVFTDMWSQLDTNHTVAALWPNDGDGNAWSDPENGFPPVLEDQGYAVVDPGRYENLTDDFSSQLSQFRQADAEIVTGVPIPPDFTTFWTQAAQQGFTPKIASVGKALLFPSAVEALDDLGEGMSTEVWWSPSHPYSSSLTGQSAQELASAYEEDTGQQWTQPIGFVHALFEVAIDSLQRAGNVEEAAAIRDAISQTQLETVVGTVDYSTGPVPNVAKTPLVGGQWKAGTDHPYELVIVSNEQAPDIPTGGELEPLPGSE